MKWRPNIRNKYVLSREDDYLLGMIHFHPDHEAWTIEFLERFDKTFLSREVRINDLDRAKQFTTMILAERDLRDESWTKVEEMAYYLRGWVRGEVGLTELLAMICFDLEEKRWSIQYLRREYNTILDKEISLSQLDEVKKLTESLAGAPPYQYEVILHNFNKNQDKARQTIKT